MREPILWQWLGLCAYERALALQQAAWNARRSGGPDVCFALEHPPTITLGRRATAADVLVDREPLSRRGVMVHRTERGGRATYHAPGQLVVYPVVHLRERGLGIRTFVSMLEDIMLEIASAVGVAAARDVRGHGIWTARGKLGAVGIRVRDDVSVHGLALNVDLDRSGFDLIAPCGTPGLAITSLAAEGANVTVADVVAIAARACARRFDGMRSREAEEARP
jgi:lipoyl(octanoyl) transferase